MTDGVAITPGTGAEVLADELTDSALRGGSGLTGQAQYVKLYDGSPDSANKLIVSPTGGLYAHVRPSPLAGGQTMSRVTSSASINATNLKTSAGNILRISLFNTAAYMVFLKLYNKASVPWVLHTDSSGATTSGSANLTVTSTTGYVVGASISGSGIPANTSVLSITSGTVLVMSANATATASGVTITTTDVPTRTIPIPAGGSFSEEYTFGRPDSFGIGYAISKLVADNDNTALVAGDVVGEISWI